MATEAAARAFFTAPYFAVVGASSDPSKFGHKSTSSSPVHSLSPSPHPFSSAPSPSPKLTNTVFAWYIHHSLPATPINPSAPSITANSQSYPTLPNLSALPHPTETSVSIITPPKVTKKVLEEAKKLGIKGVWLQPGSFDDEILKQALEDWSEAGVGGDGGRGGEGWCVLVDGERAAKAAGKTFEKL
jgi:predicted CoA-binding protein